ncbi:MAG: CHAT domain-containing tetratricopeptide repeat protein [Ferruginibacter sp.]
MSRQYHILSMIVSLLLLLASNIFGQQDSAKVEPDSSTLIYSKFFRFSEQNRLDSAIYYAGIYEGVNKRKFGEMSEQHILALYTLGEIYRFANDYNKAYLNFRQAAEHFAEKTIDSANSTLYAWVVSRMGIVCSSMGIISDAKVYLKKGIEIYKTGKYGDGYFQMNICLADMYIASAEYVKADSIYVAMKDELDTMPPNAVVHFRQASVHNNMALVQMQTGNARKGLSSLKTAIKLERLAKKEGYIYDDYVEITLNLAKAYSINNQTDSAWIICREAEDSLRHKISPLYADLLSVKAFICQQQNKLTEAANLYEQYKKIIDSRAVRPANYEANLLNLAILYTDTRQFEKAEALLRNQITRLRRSGLQYSYEMQQSVAALCANLIDMQQYKEATDILIALCHQTFTTMSKNFQGMSEAGKLRYEKDINNIFNLLYIAVDQNKTISKHLLAEIYRLQLKRKGVVLNSQVNIINSARNSRDTVFLNAYNEWLDNGRMLTKQYSLPYKQRFLDVDSLEQRNEKLEKSISTREIETGKAIHKNRESLKNNYGHPFSADIEFIRFDYKSGKTNYDSAFYIAFILKSGDTVPVLVNLCSEKDLLQIMKNEKGEWENENQLTQNIYSRQGSSANIFYRMVWLPMEGYLAGSKTINYSTSGLFNNIAFHAIFDGKTYLADRFDFRRFFSLNDVGSKAADVKPAAISIWGNMNYDKASYNGTMITVNNSKTSGARLSLITGRSKIKAITKNISVEAIPTLHTNEPIRMKKIFAGNNIKISSYENTHASEEHFKQNASGINGVLHISTHGFYAPLDKTKTKASLPGTFIAGIENPLFRCGLAFAGVNYYWLKGVAKSGHDDGILTGYEIAQLDLHNVQLVTLSACETGLGDITDNEANLGLQRAFKMAGVHNLLVSLWQVPAKQTAELLALFYTSWLHGKSLSKALQSAELNMAKKYPPYFWAGFVLIE